MKMIDILMAIRTEDIINDYGKLSKDINKPVSLHPSVVYDKYIRILPEDEKVVSIDDVGDIFIKANVGDMIRFNGITLNNNPMYSISVLKFAPMAEKMIQEDVVKMMDLPKVEHYIKMMPVMKMDNPLDVDMQKIKSYYWMIEVNELPYHGSVRVMYYECIIGIYKEGVLQGYVAIEPGIVLDNK
ncbi:AidA/PixA family protein [Xenorhabdus bovienii]|uniref:AidA/PixA family protein n=1 Tax=Xenorhabdus bovienii TaxID=40576 RepID=UPI0004D6F5F8|nr:AidA/PixA family protein [Xenorhabdus bovienii]CDG87156.1 PixA [Xenorhabdus bovienii str. feltiae France]CDG94507.1 PixA [Xenorhabdus bovienii str. feltiae Florida]